MESVRIEIYLDDEYLVERQQWMALYQVLLQQDDPIDLHQQLIWDRVLAWVGNQAF